MRADSVCYTKFSRQTHGTGQNDDATAGAKLDMLSPLSITAALANHWHLWVRRCGGQQELSSEYVMLLCDAA